LKNNLKNIIEFVEFDKFLMYLCSLKNWISDSKFQIPNFGYNNAKNQAENLKSEIQKSEI